MQVYAEVSCARSLLEQLVLVLGGPGEPRCRAALRAFRRYLGDLEAEVGDPKRDPARRLGLGPPTLAATRFADPLEELLYRRPRRTLSVSTELSTSSRGRGAAATRLRRNQPRRYASSVGPPSSHVYETVKDARAARARRLGALQRKLPGLQFGLLR